MPNNVMEVLLRALGQGVSSLPGAMQEDTMFKRGNLREMLGMQQQQQEQSATQMYRDKMLEMQRQQQELAGNKAMMDVQQNLLAQFMTPQGPSPLDQAKISTEEARAGKLKKETELLGGAKPKEDKSKMNVTGRGVPPNILNNLMTQYGEVPPQNTIDRIMDLLSGRPMGQPASYSAMSPTFMTGQAQQAPQLDIQQVDAMIKALEDSLAAYGK